MLHTFKKPIPVRKGWVIDNIGYIPLTKGLVATVSPHWVPFLEKWNWFAKLNARSGDHYAGRLESRKLNPGVRGRYVHMARVILGMSLDDKEHVPDHINRNKLDYRVENLRVITPTENL